MSDIAVRVEGLGKQYRITTTRRLRDRTLRDKAAAMIAAPFRRLVPRWRPAPFSPHSFIWALRHVSLEVRHGEVLGLIGRNGAGKSTFLKILSRITEPTEGRAEIHGRVGSLLEVGTGFHGDLSGRENIFLNGALLGMRRREIQQKFDAIVAFAEIDQFLDTPVRHYSSGMYMRLAFAVAAHLDPEILLVDEVLAVGDAAFQKKCLGKMGEVAKQGRTVLFVSHNMNAVEQMCTAAACFEPGRTPVLRHDTPAVISEYLYGGDGERFGASAWVNPGGDFKSRWFTPLGFRLTDGQGRPLAMPAMNTADMWVQVEAEIETVDPGLTIGYLIHTETGVLLYRSTHTDQPEARWPALHRGRCVLRGRIPPRLLNAGTYRIELVAGLHGRQWLVDPGVRTAAIYLTIHGGLSDSPQWIEQRPGLLAPVIEWILAE
jgi:lipopolysaccharide transport system ATP-binding protein